MVPIVSTTMALRAGLFVTGSSKGSPNFSVRAPRTCSASSTFSQSSSGPPRRPPPKSPRRRRPRRSSSSLGRHTPGVKGSVLVLQISLMHCAKAAFRSIFASILMATTLSERSSSLRTSSKASSAPVSRLAYCSKKLSQSLGPRRSSLSISKAALVGSELVAMAMPKVLIKARMVETKVHVAFIVMLCCVDLKMWWNTLVSEKSL
mmetsp:Transcript_18929/g.44837  ORF Transcript_18929/g.44837 Transcript_18929/m.44837 type:complete len:205 (-) Transcript_18929:64-678(-)